MKNKFKNITKLGILLFGILLAITSCQKDDDLVAPTSKKLESNILKVTPISLKELKQNTLVYNKITDSKSKFNITNSTSKIINDNTNNFSINTDTGIYIENGYHHSYTFEVERLNGANYLLENLVLNKIENGYETILYQYDVTQEEFNLISERQYVDLEGKMIKTLLENSNISDEVLGKYFFNGNCYIDTQVYVAGQSCPTEGVNHNFEYVQNGGTCTFYGTIDGPTPGNWVTQSTITPCDGQGGDGSTNPPDEGDGHGGNNNGSVDSTPNTKCRTCPVLDEDPECQEALTGSLTDLTLTPDEECWLINHGIIKGQLEAYIDANGNHVFAQQAIQALMQNTNDNIVAEVDFEEQIIVNIEDSCQRKIVQNAIDIAHPLVQNIKDLFESDDKFKLNIISENLPGSLTAGGPFTPAQTTPLPDCDTDGNCIITIKLDLEMLSTSTDYFIRANVLHEMVHASLVYFYSTGELEMAGTFDPFTAMLFEAMAEFEAMQSGLVLGDGSNLNAIQHLYMTNMATDLKAALIGSDIGMDTLLPDEFYQDLTWGGSLRETSSFTEIYDTPDKVLRCAHTNTAEATANDSGIATAQGVEAEFNPICDE